MTDAHVPPSSATRRATFCLSPKRRLCLSRQAVEVAKTAAVALLLGLAVVLCGPHAAAAQNDAPPASDSTASSSSLEAEGDSLVGTIRFGRLDPQRARLFFTQTARPVESGGVYVSSLQLFYAQVGVGIGDRFSLQGSVLMVPGNDFGSLLGLTPKVTLWQGRTDALLDGVPLNLALDARTEAARQNYLVRRSGDETAFPYAQETQWDFRSTPRFLATYGTPETALTAGLGLRLSEVGQTAVPVATLGGELQLLEWLKLISENHFYFGVERFRSVYGFDTETRTLRTGIQTESVTVTELSGGARFLWDHFALEVAAIGVTPLAGRNFLSVVPVLGLSYRF